MVEKSQQTGEGQNATTEQKRLRGLSKSREGIVASNKMDKTAVVAVSTKVRHRQYGKFVVRTKKYFAHDSRNECGIGDRVLIIETRPLSKKKRWRVQSILEKAV